MADTNQRPRGGMTLDAISFRQGVFPPWPEKFRDVSPTGWVGQIWRERRAALKIAQVRHEQNEMVHCQGDGQAAGPGGARRASIGGAQSAEAFLYLHTGDITHLSKLSEFDDADRILSQARSDVALRAGRARHRRLARGCWASRK
jgi:hypothetical protein